MNLVYFNKTTVYNPHSLIRNSLYPFFGGGRGRGEKFPDWEWNPDRSVESTET